ncbi:MAG: Omp28-related outer membrane protein [Flavobacteriales bacterium]|nr:Omp28-related outer membrane protein [Flavobacteriales bacterium]
MKKIYLSFLLVALYVGASAQSQRVTLVEEFTNASCPPCAAQNPGFNALLNQNTEDVVSIKYQTAFPGYDPMNEHNPSEVNTRLNYYPEISGVPTATIDGVIPDVSPSYPGAPGAFTQPLLDAAIGVDAFFDIELSHTISYSEIVVTATVTCTQEVSGDLKFRIAVIEEEIIYDTAPGSNGEVDFYGVMKKMLPGAAGTTMEPSYEVGQTFTITESWNHSNIYDLNEVAVVVFVQNDDDKAVLQAAMDDEGVFLAETANDVGGEELEASIEGCNSTFMPTITLRNWGSETLTSADITYSLEGESNTINWSGSLEFFESEIVALGELNTPTSASAELEVEVTNPNGMMDGNASNNDVTTDVAGIAQAGTELEVTIVTDNYGEETYWRIVDESNNVLGEGGNSWVGTTNIGVGAGAPTEGAGTYGDGATNTSTVEIPAGVECYSFEIYDYWGDGICCQWGNGSYSVEDVASGDIVVSGGAFGQEEQKNFAGGILSVEEATSVEEFTLFPNPTNNVLNVEFTLVTSQRVTIDILDLTGRLVYSKDLGMQPAGYSLQSIDVSDQSQGLYLINMNVEDGQVVGKFTINN